MKPVRGAPKTCQQVCWLGSTGTYLRRRRYNEQTIVESLADTSFT